MHQPLAKVGQAWLISWEWSGDHAKVENPFVALLSYRYSGDTIRKFLERLYVIHTSDICLQIGYARNEKNYPYPAEFVKLNGVPFDGEIICGHNPFLLARRVYDFHCHTDEYGEKRLAWTERRYTVEWEDRKPKLNFTEGKFHSVYKEGKWVEF